MKADASASFPAAAKEGAPPPHQGRTVPSHFKNYFSAHGHKFNRFSSVTFISPTAVLSFSHSLYPCLRDTCRVPWAFACLPNVYREERGEVFTMQSANTSLRGETRDEPEVVSSCSEGDFGPWAQISPFMY